MAGLLNPLKAFLPNNNDEYKNALGRISNGNPMGLLDLGGAIFNQASHYLGDKTLDATGSPALATGAYMIPQAVGAIAGGAEKAFGNVGAGIASRGVGLLHDGMMGKGLLGDALSGIAPMNILKNPEMNQLAINHFGTTYRPQETGFILDDGARLDLSGRHDAGGYKKVGNKYIPETGQPDYLKNERSTDHRTVNQVIPNSEYGWDALSHFMDQTGAVRYMPDSGVSMVHTNKPNATQIQKIVNDYKVTGDPLYIDIDHALHGSNLASGEFNKPTVQNVTDWINNQYGLLK